MKILKSRNLIHFILVFLSLFIPNFKPAFSEIISRSYYTSNTNKKLYFEETLNSFSPSNSQLRLNQIPETKYNLVSNENSDQSRNIEISSDKQFQEENVVYAEGNVLVTYKGSILKADTLVYDKLNETVKASGNIKLILENQVFSVEKLNYDFKTQKGAFINVKGLIRTKNLIEDLELTSNEFKEITSTLQKINKKKVLYTPDGVNNWIFYTKELKVDNNQWIAKKAFFTNDLLETNQVKFEINSLRIIPKDDLLKLKSSISYLIFEDKLPIPFWFGNRTLNKTKDGDFLDFTSKWYLGLDKVDRDGYFLGRSLKPINISNNFLLKLEPQFLIQRALQGYTKSFVNKGDSITADKVRKDVNFSDYFGLNSELEGKINDWDLRIDNNLYSLDFNKFLDAYRLKVDLSKDIDFLGSTWNKSFYGVYRDRIWNGSIGDSEIYFGYGTKLEKNSTWDVDGIQKTEILKLGLGEFKGEGLNNKNLASSYKGSIFYSLEQKFPLIVKKSKDKFIDNSFKYTFEPVTQGIYLDTKLEGLYSFYENGHHQKYIGFGAGPEFTIGEFKKKYFDYTRIRLFPFYRLKSGDSIFKFDQVSDQFTLNLSLDQQLYGPILLKADSTLNLDSNSDNYGDFTSSKISLSWQRRSYELGLFYQPHNQSGGISFTLHGFE